MESSFCDVGEQFWQHKNNFPSQVTRNGLQISLAQGTWQDPKLHG